MINKSYNTDVIYKYLFEYCSNMQISGNINFIFLCGAEDTEEKKSLRTIFLEYFSKYIKSENFIFIKAEEFFNIRKRFKANENLLDLENYITSICDCILLFIESSGSLAELGAFSNKKDVVKKMLVVNDKHFINSKSFVNDGPVSRVNKYSNYKPVIYLNYKYMLEDVNKIIVNLQKNKKKKRNIFSIDSFASVMDNSSKITTIFLIIGILTPITKKEAMHFLIKLGLFKNKNKNDEFLFDLVLSLNHFKEISNNSYIVPTKFYNKLMKEKPNSTKMFKYRAKILQYYYKHDKERFNSLKKGINNNE